MAEREAAADDYERRGRTEQAAVLRRDVTVLPAHLGPPDAG
jgi:hypothetical protein